MRKINTRNFQLATRSTPRDVNRRIVLNLIREYQPISRAELARRMSVRRGTLTTLVRELVESGIVFEKGTAAAARGRRPTMLCVRTRGRLVVAVDVRSGRSSIALSDVGGRMLARETFDTPASPDQLAELLASEVTRLLRQHAPNGTEGCQGIGIVLPGMVDRKTGRLLYAPRLGWRDVDLRASVSARIGMKVYIESAPIACALARLWLEPEATRSVNSFAYVSVSEGIGVGLVVNGEMLRGETHTAGEFGHVSLDSSGPECVCGRRGCWEALACNAATVERYADAIAGVTRDDGKARRARKASFPGIEEVIRRARGGEAAAVQALVETAGHIGRGLSLIVSAFNPGRIYVGGEITEAWDLLEAPMRAALVAGTIPGTAGATQVVPDSSLAEYRLLGAVALVTAPGYAALAVG
ncbi:MAG: ROK family transcriptional regulator [Gemmatimonadota bacterium]|nr:ROK family transcriptional regulator [Gemmatimonadota bacterium]